MRNWRINLVLTFIILFGAAIIGRLVFLQILNHDFYKALARGQQQIVKETTKNRGEIFLKDKEDNLYPLAINKNWPLVYSCPQEIENKEETSQILSQILDLDKDVILEKIKRDERFYQLLKNKLSLEEEARLKKENLPGIYLKEETLRYYLQEAFASQIIGFVGGEGKGQYGIEGYYNDILEGTKREKGTDLILTLDYNIQFEAERLLEAYQERLDFKEGQILVINPKSGRVKALAHFPNFNPNLYSEVEDMEIFQNGAIQKFFEPGSVFKSITMAAALEEEKISPQTLYEDKGYVKIGQDIVRNYGENVWGWRSMTEVLEKSINTGAIFIEQQLGHELFLSYIEKFGFFQPTGIDLQEEFFSANLEFKKGYEINFATASFGQGIAMTPIQLVRAYCVIANGGKMIKPHLVEGMEGTERMEDVISPKTAFQLTAMLVSVVKNGFAKGAQIPGYYIAGKTGTAQVPWSALGIDKSDYSDETVQTFVGFAPAFDPKFLILIKLNNPKTRTAEYSAVPIFQQLAKYIIDYWQIPPDYE